ncbi:MAG: DUF4129 domain-containing protein [Candidatus Acidiferrales bacterium]
MKRAAWLVMFAATLLFLAPFLRPAAFGGQSSATPSNPPLTLQQYTAELDRCSEVLNNRQSDPAAYRNLRATLPVEWTVADGGQTYIVSTSWLTSALAALRTDTPANNPLLKETRQKLAALRTAAENLEEPSPSSDLQQSRARLDHILSAKEFQSGRGPSWLDLLKARVYDWIGRQLERLFGRLRHGRAIGNAIAWGLILLAALLLAFWAVRASLRAGRQTEMDLDPGARPEGGWRDWLRNGRAAAERGDYRAAIHGAYWAGVMRLEEVHCLPQDRARTPREALRLIRRDSVDYAPLAQLTRRFELVWYGYRAATETDWSDAMEQLEKLGCLPSSMPAIAAS